MAMTTGSRHAVFFDASALFPVKKFDFFTASTGKAAFFSQNAILFNPIPHMRDAGTCAPSYLCRQLEVSEMPVGQKAGVATGSKMVVFRKVTVTMLTILFAYISVAVGAPLALDGATVEKAATGVTRGNKLVDTGTHQASAFALVQDRAAGDLAENKASGGLMKSVPLSPAFLLFAGALGAIFWLGRRRKTENSNWE